MSLTISIPSPLRAYTSGEDVIEVSGKTVGLALESLIKKYPPLKKQLYTEDGHLRSFVNVYLNDEDIRYLQKAETAVAPGDTISIVPSIAGGKSGKNGPFSLEKDRACQILRWSSAKRS